MSIPFLSTLLLIISLDGVSWEHFNAHKDQLPHLSALARAGVSGKSLTVFPSVTWPAHASIVTGRYPSGHGVVGNYFYDRQKRQLVRTWEVDSKTLYKAPALYDVAHKGGLTAGAILWPGTCASPSLRWNIPELYRQQDYQRCSSKGFLKRLADAGIPTQRLEQHSQREMYLLDSLARDAAVWVIENQRPDLMLVHFVATDTLGHKVGPNTRETVWALKLADRYIGDLLASYKKAGLTNRLNVMVVSDHGFSEVNVRLDPNRVLHKAGVIPSLSALKSAPVAVVPNGYTLSVYVHDQENKKKHLADVVAAFKREGVVKQVFMPADFNKLGLPTPQQSPRAPDMILLSKPSIYFKFTSGAVRENLGRKGMHGHLPSAPGNQPLFIGAGPGFKTKTSPVSVRNIDVAPTAARLLNLSWPGATDGRVLQDILQ